MAETDTPFASSGCLPGFHLFCRVRFIVWRLRGSFKGNIDETKAFLDLPRIWTSVSGSLHKKRPCATLWLGGLLDKYLNTDSPALDDSLSRLSDYHISEKLAVTKPPWFCVYAILTFYIYIYKYIYNRNTRIFVQFNYFETFPGSKDQEISI